jgi:hypothetical protein
MIEVLQRFTWNGTPKEEFGKQGFPQLRPALRADEWLGVHPDTPHAYDE